MTRKHLFFTVLPLLILNLLIAACTGTTASEKGRNFELAPLTDLPLEVQNSPEVVSAAYQFAVTNPDVLSKLPCYCGCGGMGHTSNYSCYVANEKTDGTLIFDGHALGCSICVDIAQDAMRMLDNGKSMTEIRSYVDLTYSAFGPSNMPDNSY